MKVDWTLAAMTDRESIFDFIESDNPRAAVVVDDRIETQVEGLLDSPERGRRGRVNGTRELVILRTPYVAVYQIEDGLIKVLRVLHGAQAWPPEAGLPPSDD
jgi:toxin ParE1/3/4